MKLNTKKSLNVGMYQLLLTSWHFNVRESIFQELL